jgi:hypothetical protein
VESNHKVEGFLLRCFESSKYNYYITLVIEVFDRVLRCFESSKNICVKSGGERLFTFFTVFRIIEIGGGSFELRGKRAGG